MRTCVFTSYDASSLLPILSPAAGFFPLPLRVCVRACVSATAIRIAASSSSSFPHVSPNPLRPQPAIGRPPFSRKRLARAPASHRGPFDRSCSAPLRLRLRAPARLRSAAGRAHVDTYRRMAAVSSQPRSPRESYLPYRRIKTGSSGQIIVT